MAFYVPVDSTQPRRAPKPSAPEFGGYSLVSLSALPVVSARCRRQPKYTSAMLVVFLQVVSGLSPSGRFQKPASYIAKNTGYTAETVKQALIRLQQENIVRRVVLDEGMQWFWLVNPLILVKGNAKARGLSKKLWYEVGDATGVAEDFTEWTEAELGLGGQG